MDAMDFVITASPSRTTSVWYTACGCIKQMHSGQEVGSYVNILFQTFLLTENSVTWMARALLGSRPVNTLRPNTRYVTIGEAVFTLSCRRLKTGPCRVTLHHTRFQGNAVVNTLVSRKSTLCEPVARQHDMMWPDTTVLTGSVFLALFLAI
jgi:hypothetical protein